MNASDDKIQELTTVIIVRVSSIKIPVFVAQHRPERDRHHHIE